MSELEKLTVLKARCWALVELLQALLADLQELLDSLQEEVSSLPQKSNNPDTTGV